MTRRRRFAAAVIASGLLAVGVITPPHATASGIYGSETVSIIPEPYILATSGFKGPTVRLNVSELEDPNFYVFSDDSGRVSNVTVTRNGVPVPLEETSSFVTEDDENPYFKFAELATATGTPAGGTWQVSYTVDLFGLWYCSIHSSNGCTWINPRTLQVNGDSTDGVVSQPTLAPRVKAYTLHGRRITVFGIGENRGESLDGSVAVQARGSNGVWTTLRSAAYSLTPSRVILKTNPPGRRVSYRTMQTANGGWATGYSEAVSFVKRTEKKTVRKRVDGKIVKRIVKRKTWVEKP